MNKQARGLGRGLDALLPDLEVVTNENVTEIDVDKIVANKFQPRREFDEEAMQELTHSIKQYGVIQPIVVRKTLQGFELVAGERRWRACRAAGLKVIPAVVREYTDAEMTEIALIENLQRENLNAIEEALAYRLLMEKFGLTQEEVARKIGRSRSMIANTVRLLNLHPIIQNHVSRGTLSMGQARPLLALETNDLQLKAAEMIIEEDLSARDAEELVRKLSSKPRPVKQPVAQSDEKEIFVVEAEDKLKLILGTQVKIKPGKMKSKIEIEFYSAEDLDRIIEVLTVQQTAAATRVGNTFVV